MKSWKNYLQLNEAKNKKFLELENLDFRANGTDTHRKLSQMNENISVVIVNNKQLTNNKTKALPKASSGNSKIMKIDKDAWRTLTTTKLQDQTEFLLNS